MGEGQGEMDPYLRVRSYKIGIFGWRKRCLYALLILLLLVVAVNLALTLWIMKVLDFSVEGIGSIRVVKGGLVLDGNSWVMGQLIASDIRSRANQPISLQASSNFSVQVRNTAGEMASQLTLGPGGLEVMSNFFQVTDQTGVVLFSASPSQVRVGAHTLQVTGEGGAVFDGSIETPIVRAEAGHELKLESATRSLEISAPLGVAIESRAGDISAACLTDLKLQSTGGTVRIDSARVLLPRLPIAAPTSRGQHLAPEGADAFQVCACANGKLFLVPPDGACIADSLVCQ